MSTAEMALFLRNAERDAPSVRQRAFRLVLYRSEALSIALPRRSVRVLSGTAWISANGLDIVLEAGQSAEFPIGREPAVISAIGGEAVLFELR